MDLSFPRLRQLLRPELRALPLPRLVASLTDRLGGGQTFRLVLADGWLHTPQGSVRLEPRECAILAPLAEAAPQATGTRPNTRYRLGPAMAGLEVVVDAD